MLEPSKWEVVSGNEYLRYWENSEERHDVRKIIMHDDYSTAKMPSYSDVGKINDGVICMYETLNHPRAFREISCFENAGSTEAYSGLSRTFKLKLFAKIINRRKLLTVSAKSSILNNELGSEYVSEVSVNIQ